MLQRRSGVQAVGDTVKGKISGSGGSSGRPRQGRSCSTQALKKGGEKSETEPDLSDSGVVRSWQALRAAHAHESKQRFARLLETFRQRCGTDKDSTAFLLE